MKKILARAWGYILVVALMTLFVLDPLRVLILAVLATLFVAIDYWVTKTLKP